MVPLYEIAYQKISIYFYLLDLQVHCISVWLELHSLIKIGPDLMG